MVHRNSVRALERSADGTATAVGGKGDNGGISVTRRSEDGEENIGCLRRRESCEKADKASGLGKPSWIAGHYQEPHEASSRETSEHGAMSLLCFLAVWVQTWLSLTRVVVLQA